MSVLIKLDAAVDFDNANAILTKYGPDIRPDVAGGEAIDGTIDSTKYEGCKRELIADRYAVV